MVIYSVNYIDAGAGISGFDLDDYYAHAESAIKRAKYLLAQGMASRVEVCQYRVTDEGTRAMSAQFFTNQGNRNIISNEQGKTRRTH